MATGESCAVRQGGTLASSQPIYKSAARPILASQPRTVRRRISSQENLATIERLEPLGVEEYERNYRQKANDLQLIERVFLGSLANNQLRAALWPYLFGLIQHRGRFKRKRASSNGGLAPPTSDDDDDDDNNNNNNNNEDSIGNEQQQVHRDEVDEFVFIEHKANKKRWLELQDLYYSYQAQWKMITADQEERFSLFRERKALIGRDVIRCDRLHPFYADQTQNLDLLSSLLMTYMMYDFDIGYVQGMSDLAGPILYIFDGNLVKAFWVFVEVMKLVRRNFEHTQKSIHFQLSCLYELIRNTDPVFARYLKEQESSNCFFAFRAIVCQFKRELMKDDEDYYDKCLQLWDTIWCVERRCVLEAELNAINQGEFRVGSHESPRSQHLLHYHHHSRHFQLHHPSHQHQHHQRNSYHHHSNHYHSTHHLHHLHHHLNHHQNQMLTGGSWWAGKQAYLSSSPKSPRFSCTPTTTTTTNGSSNSNNSPFRPQIRDQIQPDTPRHNLTETEMFILALCLAMILRERDTILANRLDGNDIHLHFIEPKLANQLKGFIQHAINIYRFMKNDLDLSRLTSPRGGDESPAVVPLPVMTNPQVTTGGQTLAAAAATTPTGINGNSNAAKSPLEEFHLGSPGSLEGYDFLSDFLIIHRVPDR